MGLLDFILYSEKLHNNPLLIIGTCRIEEVPEKLQQLMSHPQATCTKLSRLNQNSIKAMITYMLATPAIPRAFVQLVSKHCEGNPFFLSEYLRFIIAQDMIKRDSAGRWGLRKAVAEIDDTLSNVPASLHELILKRFQGIPYEAKQVLKIAAVFNRSVTVRFLMIVTEWSEQKLVLTLNDIIQCHIMEYSTDNSYRFVHQKTRDILYQNVEENDLISLHRVVAEAIEICFSSNVADYCLDLALHWEKAQENEKACFYYKAAAQAMKKQHSYKDAAKLFQNICR